MKNFLFLTLVLVANSFNMGFSQSQTLAGKLGPVPAISPSSGFFVDYTDGRPVMLSNPDISGGSPFLTDDWNTGTVLLKGNKIISGIYLKYNVYNQELYFKRGDREMVFADSVYEFQFSYLHEGEKKNVYFRCGYPVTGKLTSASYYEVLVDSTFQLLKAYQKELVTEEPVNRPKTLVLKDYTAYYIYMPGKLIRIKADKKSLAEALPHLTSEIAEITSKNNLKLKTEPDLIRLFQLLNQVVRN